MQGKKCSLAINTKTNIVAKALVFERKGPNEKIHHTILGEQFLRVSIKEAFYPDAVLPIPVSDELTFVKDAIGTFVPWPKEFVLISVEVIYV